MAYTAPQSNTINATFAEPGYTAPAYNTINAVLSNGYNPPQADSISFDFSGTYGVPASNSISFAFLTEPGETIDVTLPTFEATVVDATLGNIIDVSLPQFSATLNNADKIDAELPKFSAALTGNAISEVDLPHFSASLTGNAVAEVILPQFSADLTGNAISNVELPKFGDGGVLLHEGEAWNEPVLPAFQSFATSFELCAVSPYTIKIDHTKITEPIGNFPIRVQLSGSCGLSGFDASALFYALGIDENRFKIAVTTEDKLTQCYVEIEPGFDFEAQVLNLWVRVPFVSATQDTTLHLFFDPTMADNTEYVGDTGSTAAQNVWDSSYKGVWHMGQVPAGAGSIKDSTENVNHGEPFGLSAEALTDGAVGKAIDFSTEGSTGVTIEDNPSLDITGNITVETIVRPGTVQNFQRIAARSNFSYGSYQFNLRTRYVDGVEGYETVITTSTTGSGTVESGVLVGPEAGFRYVASTIDTVSKLLSIIVDSEKLSNSYTGIKSTTDTPFTIGYRSFSGDNYKGTIDEVRISNVVRSDNWLTASRYSYLDQLITLDCPYTPESAAALPTMVFHSSHIHDVSLPMFKALGLTNATVNAILPYFKAALGYAGEINVELPYFSAEGISVSEILADISARFPHFQAALAGMVEKIIQGNCDHPRFSVLLNASSASQAGIEASMAAFQASITSGQSVDIDGDVSLPLLCSHLQASNAKEFYKLRYRERYWE